MPADIPESSGWALAASKPPSISANETVLGAGRVRPVMDGTSKAKVWQDEKARRLRQGRVQDEAYLSHVLQVQMQHMDLWYNTVASM